MTRIFENTPRSFRHVGLRFRPVVEAGAYYARDEAGNLLTVPMCEDGTPDKPALHRVASVEDNRILHMINKCLGTRFEPWDLPGR